jgi:hypothetical protein
MKIPQSPPDIGTIWARVRKAQDRFEKVFSAAAESAFPGRYLHWDRLRYCAPPADLSHEEWWLALKLNRRAKSKQKVQLRLG